MPQDSTSQTRLRRSAFYGFAEYVWNTERSRWLLRPRWKPIGSAALALLVIGYVGTAAAYYSMNRWHRDCEDTSFREMLLFVFPEKIPFTNVVWAPDFVVRRVESARESHRRKLAAMLFARAKSALERQDWRNFYNDIFHASQMDPSNHEARLLSARVFLAMGRDDDALDALEEALPSLLDRPDYVKEYVRDCFIKGREARLVGVSRHLLGQTELIPPVRELLAVGLATAHYHRGEFEECLAVIDREKISRTRDGFLLRLRILSETGHRDKAIAALEPVAMSATNDPSLFSLLIDMKKEAGDIEGARSAAALYLIGAADKHQARIKFIELLDMTKEVKRRDEAIAAYRNDFKGKTPALLLLCEFGADRGLVPLCDDLMKEADAAKLPEAPRFELLFIESHLAARRYAETVSLVDKLFLRNPKWLPSIRRTFDCLRMVAQMSMNREDMAEIAFRRLSDTSEPPDMRVMTNVAKKLIQVGRPDDAIRVINLAFDRNAQTSTALGEVVAIHLAAGGSPETPALLRRLLAFRRPDQETLVKAREMIAGDAFLYEKGRDELLANLETLAKGKPILPDVPARPPKTKIEAK